MMAAGDARGRHRAAGVEPTCSLGRSPATRAPGGQQAPGRAVHQRTRRPRGPRCAPAPPAGGGDTGPITATCAEDVPPWIPPGAPTSGPGAEGAAPPTIHAALPRRGLRPGTPLGDPGCLDAERLVARQAPDAVELLGPTRLDDPWQARPGAGCDAPHGPIAGAPPHASGPAGKTRTGWTPAIATREHPVITVKGSTQDCRRGHRLEPWIRSTPRAPRRPLPIRPQPP
jgi:hypothetical protein